MMGTQTVVSQDLENLKSDSPVIAIQELAKSRSLQPEFKITKEDGPQHEKNFEILLSLGPCSWKGEGGSVKKAQMDAAKKALKELGVSVSTKAMKKTKIANPASLTPTVVLNGLAMTRGENVEYKVVSKIPLPCQPIYNNSNSFSKQHPLNWTKMYYGVDMTQSYNSFFFDNYPKPDEKPVKRWIYPQLYRISVEVGGKSFIGEGKTQQAARHNAAQNALDVLQQMTIPKKVKVKTEQKKSQAESNDTTKDETKPAVPKSPISLLFEKSASHNLKVEFDVISETGPAHMKIFTISTKVYKSESPSDILVNVEGVGHSKNIAKTNSAAAAFIVINGMELPVKNTKSKNPRFRKREKSENNNSTKASAIMSTNETLHPCSRLTQILQAKQEKMPVYTQVSSEISKHEASFIIRCDALGETATGEGKSKKDAKRLATENMLIKLGFLPSEKTEPAKSVSTDSGKTVSIKKNKSKLNFKNKLTETDVLPPLVEV